MPDVTANEGWPYALEPDYGDVQDWYNLAVAADARARALNGVFASAPRPKAFSVRTAGIGPNIAGGAGGTMGSGGVGYTVEWDTSGGTFDVTGAWNQNPADTEAIWIFGAMFVTINAGTVSTNDNMVFNMFWSTTNPLTSVTAVPSYRSPKVRRETNSGGDPCGLMTIVPMYRGSIVPQLSTFGVGTGLRSIGQGSRFWGVRLGSTS